MVLEDDIVSVKDEKLVKEEVLLLAMDDLTLIVDSEADARTVSAQVLGLQIDNEFDDATKFPVVALVNYVHSTKSFVLGPVVASLGVSGRGAQGTRLYSRVVCLLFSNQDSGRSLPRL